MPWTSGWGLWAVRTALTAVICTATVGAAVWLAGDRLLTHALTGFQTAVSTNTTAINELRAEINGIGAKAADDFVKALQGNHQIEVKLTTDLGILATSLTATQEHLSHTNERLGYVTDELEGLYQLISSNEARWSAWREEEAEFRGEMRGLIKTQQKLIQDIYLQAKPDDLGRTDDADFRPTPASGN